MDNILKKRKNTSNKRISRVLRRKEPKIIENTKSALILKGNKVSGNIKHALSDINRLKKPFSTKFERNNKVLPFEDETSLEFFATKTDCSLFAFGSHSKKRPNNLILGRFFNFHILDMIELGIQSYKAIDEFAIAPAYGSKACFIFTGPEWEQQTEFQKLSNLFLDFFRGEVIEKINLAGLDHVYICTVSQNIVYFRHYMIELLKSGTQLPHVELKQCGPSMDLVIRRTKFADPELWKFSTKVPKQLKKKKEKSKETTDLRQTIATIHMGKQDFDKMATRKFKGTKKRGRSSEEDSESNEKSKKHKSIEEEGEGEEDDYSNDDNVNEKDDMEE